MGGNKIIENVNKNMIFAMKIVTHLFFLLLKNYYNIILKGAVCNNYFSEITNIPKSFMYLILVNYYLYFMTTSVVMFWFIVKCFFLSNKVRWNCNFIMWLTVAHVCVKKCQTYSFYNLHFVRLILKCQ